MIAHSSAERVVSRARELDYERGMNMGLLLHSELALAEGAFAQAHQCLEESPAPAHQDTLASRELGQLARLGLAVLGLGQLAEAREHLVAALARASEAQDLPDMLVSLAALALLSAKEGKAEQGVELYALASRHPSVANSRWLEDVDRRQITAAAATLPAEVTRAARERGQARDLETSHAELVKEGVG